MGQLGKDNPRTLAPLGKQAKQRQKDNNKNKQTQNITENEKYEQHGSHKKSRGVLGISNRRSFSL